MTVTVITLEGLMPDWVDIQFGLMAKMLNGYANSSGHTQLRFPLGTSMTSSGMASEVDRFDVFLKATTGDVEIEAHSRGAQIAGDWMDKYGRVASPDLIARIKRFILLGNPQRALGGAGKKSADNKPLPRTPTDVPFTVVDFCRSRDGWANADGWWKVPGAVKPQSTMLFANMFTPGSVHTNYNSVTPWDSDVLSRGTTNDTNYLVSPQ